MDIILTGSIQVVPNVVTKWAWAVGTVAVGVGVSDFPGGKRHGWT